MELLQFDLIKGLQDRSRQAKATRTSRMISFSFSVDGPMMQRKQISRMFSHHHFQHNHTKAIHIALLR
uniref:Uncharacterized protein n=1 Tax=Oryza meridionalis TaxID=40149 RepID=A0A0E0CJ59_9ORYZ